MHLLRTSAQEHGRKGDWAMQVEPTYLVTHMSIPEETRWLTIRRTDRDLSPLAELEKLVELTLESPTPEQLDFVCTLPYLRRLRVISTKWVDLAGIEDLSGLEELALLNVTQFKTLEPISSLPSLRSLMIVSARHFSDVSAVAKMNQLRCVVIDGTFDSHQQVASLDPFTNHPSLAHIALGYVRVLQQDNKFHCLETMKSLQTLYIYPRIVSIEDWAYLVVRIPQLKTKDEPIWRIDGPQDMYLSTHGIPEELATSDALYQMMVYLKGERGGWDKSGSYVVRRCHALNEKLEAAIATELSKRT